MKVRRIALVLLAAVLIAGAALGASVALGSGSAKRDAGGNDQPYSGPLKASRVGPEKKTQWAVIESDGTFVRGSKAVTGSLHTGLGNYIVFFKKDIRHCAFVASTGVTGDLSSTVDYATTAIANGTINGVFVRTLDATGTNVDVSFHLIIACNNS